MRTMPSCYYGVSHVRFAVPGTAMRIDEESETDRTVRLRAVIRRMKHASDTFYALAAMAGNHSFIEFTGLLNEYIQVCSRAIDDGIDFTMASTHTGVALPMESYNFGYLAEKLNCIYGPSLVADPKRLEAFVAKISGGLHDER